MSKFAVKIHVSARHRAIIGTLSPQLVCVRGRGASGIRRNYVRHPAVRVMLEVSNNQGNFLVKKQAVSLLCMGIVHESRFERKPIPSGVVGGHIRPSEAVSLRRPVTVRQ